MQEQNHRPQGIYANSHCTNVIKSIKMTLNSKHIAETTQENTGRGNNSFPERGHSIIMFALRGGRGVNQNANLIIIVNGSYA